MACLDCILEAAKSLDSEDKGEGMMEPSKKAIEIAEKRIIDYLLNLKWDEDMGAYPVRKVLQDLVAPLEKRIAELEDGEKELIIQRDSWYKKACGRSDENKSL